MAQDGKPHIVRLGDTPLRLAVMYDVTIEDIKAHEKNKKFKAEIEVGTLPIGETVMIPEPKPLSLNVSPKVTNKFRAKVPMHRVVIVFQDARGPLKNEPYKLEGLQKDPVEGTLDAIGALDIQVPIFIEKLTLKFEKRNVKHTLWVGHLAPVRQQFGVQSRLLHLGYGPVGQRAGDPFTFADAEAEARAIAAFQTAFGLEPTGFADKATTDQIVKLHGLEGYAGN